MPPTLFTVLQFPFTQLAYVIFPVSVSNGIIAGAFTFCEFVHRFQKRCADQAMLRYPVRLHALCVGYSSLRVRLTSDLLLSNSGYTIRNFRST